MSELAIIIPAKDEEQTIGRLFESIGEQSYPMDDVKIYLADANSADHTIEEAYSIAWRFGLLQLEIIDGGLPAAGRNAGAKLADSRYLLFLDADIELEDPEFIANAITKMKNKGLHCATTDIHCPDGDWKSKACYGVVNVFQRGSRFLGIPFSTGMCMLFDREEFVRLGGFREDALYAEDYMLSKQVDWKRFRVIAGGVATSDRRMRKMGYWKLAKLFFSTALLGWRETQFTKDHGYWN
jgi:glycosyltransferase involved in cell wall biosynthesis